MDLNDTFGINNFSYVTSHFINAADTLVGYFEQMQSLRDEIDFSQVQDRITSNYQILSKDTNHAIEDGIDLYLSNKLDSHLNSENGGAWIRCFTETYSNMKKGKFSQMLEAIIEDQFGDAPFYEEEADIAIINLIRSIDSQFDFSGLGLNILFDEEGNAIKVEKITLEES